MMHLNHAAQYGCRLLRPALAYLAVAMYGPCEPIVITQNINSRRCKSTAFLADARGQRG